MADAGGKLTKSIDVKLSELEAMTPYGYTLEQKEISDYCGCSRPYISMIERSAKAKIKKKFPQLAEYL